MILLLGFAFLSGIITILMPCIWPLLPIILSSSATGGKRKPLGIVLGIMTSFSIFTLAISYIVKIFPFDPNNLRLIAVIVITVLGLTLIIPALSQILEGWLSRLSSRLSSKTQTKGHGFKGGYLTGFALGIVWAPCAGPILATIATLAATQAINIQVIFVTLAYTLGVGIPLFIFSYAGNRFFTKSKFISRYTGRIQQVFGVVMILTALAIYTNYDKVLQAKLLDMFPSYTNLLIGLERNKGVKSQLDALKGKKTRIDADTSGLFNTNYPAPEFAGITKWLNTDHPLTIKGLRGRVVLIDFWTYTCINCIRTLPHVTSWYDKYKDQGFVVIGVHTPEFEFEKDSNNVLNAIKQYNIHYPVPQDNNYATWNAYNNQYWPAEYLIDAKGIIRRTHFGEGKYDETEKAIQALLKEAGQQVSTSLDTKQDSSPKNAISREAYLGSRRMQYLDPNGQVGNGVQNFALSNTPASNSFSFGGNWNITDETAIAGDKATLNLNFTAQKVFLVLRPGTAGQNAKVKVYVDGKLADSTNAGADVKDGIVTIDSDRLFNLVDLKGKTESHILKLEYLVPGIEAFAFTFG